MQNNRVSESEMVACFQSTSLESLPEQATKQEADLENAKAGLPQWNTGCVKPKKHPQFKKVQEPSRIIKSNQKNHQNKHQTNHQKCSSGDHCLGGQNLLIETYHLVIKHDIENLPFVYDFPVKNCDFIHV